MITVSGLTKRYGERTVVDDVSFTLEPGTVTGFLGPNGAGKTTTMRMVTGLVPATAGTALVDGRPYGALPNPGAVMGTLLDAGAVHPGRTGRTHLRILAAAIGVPAAAGGRGARAGRARRRGRTPDPRLLARHAAAARHRRCAAGRPAGADVRRAGQRAGPGGHPVDARPAARPRRPRRHGAAVVPPARRGRAHRRPAAGDRRRADRRRRAGGLAARRGRRLGPGRRHRRPGADLAARATPSPPATTARWWSPAPRPATSAPSRPPAGTCSPTSGRSSAASRTSSSPSPPRPEPRPSWR